MAELLRWMVAGEAKRGTNPFSGVRRTAELWRGGDLIAYYQERAIATGHHTYGTRGGGYAQHGWRRAGGTALKNLANRGFVELVDFNIGVPEYRITQAGREAVADS